MTARTIAAGVLGKNIVIDCETHENAMRLVGSVRFSSAPGELAAAAKHYWRVSQLRLHDAPLTAEDERDYPAMLREASERLLAALEADSNPQETER